MLLDRLSRALLYAAAHYQEQPSLEALATKAGLSAAHFQREFRRHVGISPKAFVQHLSARQAAAELRRGKNVLSASLSAGLSGPGRLHDLMIKVEGVTPGEVSAGGSGLRFYYALVASPFGRLFAAVAPRGVVAASFNENPERAYEALRRAWPKAALKSDASAVSKALAPFWSRRGQAAVWVPGSAFQLQIWRALVRVPAGTRLSYSALATKAGYSCPRAVGTAVARNPVALLIPCHRVIQASGAVGEYHWGRERKRALLAWESA